MGIHNQRKHHKLHHRSSIDYRGYPLHLSWNYSAAQKSTYSKKTNSLKTLEVKTNLFDPNNG